MIGYWETLHAALEGISGRPRGWHAQEWELFFEVEAVLHLYETLVPQAERRNANDAWALISGYCVKGVNAASPEREMCIRLRHNLKYVKAATRWRYWLNWYSAQPVGMRLYQFDERNADVLSFQQRVYEAAFRELRLRQYANLFTQVLIPTKHSRSFAGEGTYTFKVAKKRYSVTITPQMAAFADAEMPKRTLHLRSERQPLHIDLDGLAGAATELDEREAQLKTILKPRGWASALNDLRLALIQETGLIESRRFTLDGLLHLVGMLGTGKSTLIWLLTYALAKEGLHVTVVMNTIVESMRMAVWLRQMGISATPALGRDRIAHERRVAFSDERGLSIERLYHGESKTNPIFAWMPSPCAVSGSLADPLPQNALPCYSLRSSDDEDRTKYTCPLLPVCSVHQVSRDLIESRVWVINPLSFLYTRAPLGIDQSTARLFEAIYRQSDVVIIDEADRVQAQWDREFAPSQPLAGSSDSLLDRLHQDLGNRFVGEVGRREAATAQFHQLSTSENQAHRLSSQLFRLLMKHPAVVQWIKRQFLTTERVFGRLQRELVKKEPKLELRPQLEKQIGDLFHAYWRNPLGRESGDLADWVNQLLTTNPSEQYQVKLLERWLKQQMGWKNQQVKQHRPLLYKLQFALIFAALIKRTNEIRRQVSVLAGEFDVPDMLIDAIPQMTANLVPDPPIGGVLGVQYFDGADGQSLGVFNFVQYGGIGRWLLLNFHRAYVDQGQGVGPHVLLTSATSWLPGSAQFHLATPPQIALLPPLKQEEPTIRLASHYIQRGEVPLSVSGSKHPKENLRQMVDALVAPNGRNPSVLEAELNYWKAQSSRRRILLIVSSYEQTDLVLDQLNRKGWEGRALCLLPDDATAEHSYTLRARQSEQFHQLDADVLIAPLLAIQRGFNILDDQGEKALLGSAFFLVRPFPPTDDLTAQIMGMNAWTMERLDDGMRTLAVTFSQQGHRNAMQQFRRAGHHHWHSRLQKGRYGVDSMSVRQYDEYLRDQFVVVWQTIGRLLRNGSSARIYFVDYAFGKSYGKRQLLSDWAHMLNTLVQSGTLGEQALAQTLYGQAQRAFSDALKSKRIY